MRQRLVVDELAYANVEVFIVCAAGLERLTLPVARVRPSALRFVICQRERLNLQDV